MKMTKSIIIILVAFFLLPLSLYAASLDDFIDQRESSDATAYQPSPAIERPKINYSSENMRDPFKDLLIKKAEISTDAQQQIAAAPLPQLTVQGVIWGEKAPLAIINNKVLKENDIVEGATVIKITQNGVIVSFGGIEHNLSSPAAVGSIKETLSQED